MIGETHDLWRDIAVQVLMDSGIRESLLMAIDLSGDWCHNWELFWNLNGLVRFAREDILKGCNPSW
jgi:hypothetical protein